MRRDQGWVVPMSEPILGPDATLRDVVQMIEQTRRLIAVLVDPDGRLLGILSDGDIRRALLAGYGLQSAAAAAMTRNPIVASTDVASEDWLAFMIERGVNAVPV